MTSNPTTSQAPVSVFSETLFAFVSPSFKYPAPAVPPAIGRRILFAPASTVKLASGSSQAWRDATLGDP